MRPVSSEEAAPSEASASLVQASWSASEMLAVVAGGLAMLLVVGFLDVLNLLP